MSEPRHFTVVGAGTVGVCCAVQLQRDGHRVTLIDRGTPGSGCSHGNAGIIQIGGSVPIATPGVLKQVPRMLLDPEGPLIIRWQYLLSLAPYLTRFVASARPDRVEATSKVLAGFLAHAIDTYRPLIDAAGAQRLIRETGELYVYQSDAAFAAAQAGHEIRRRRGVRIEPVSIEELRQLEPALAPIIRHALLFPDCISTIDPEALTVALAEHFVRDGGTLLRANVVDIEVRDREPLAVVTDSGRHAVDRLVLATGAHSRRWATRFGARLPLDTERGYHVMLPDPGVSFGRAVVFGDQRIGLTSMSGGLRVAGTAELARLDAEPNYARAHRLLPIAKRIVPDLKTDGAHPWMGQRPSTPDSLPVIGRAPGSVRAFFAFGHGHLGLTLGAVTGRLVADIAAGRTPIVDPAPFRAERFRLFEGGSTEPAALTDPALQLPGI